MGLTTKTITSVKNVYPRDREHHWVTLTQLKDYLHLCHQQQRSGVLPLALNTWLGYQAFFCGELVAVDLRHANLSGVCFNGATLRHCQLGGNLKGAQFIESTWDHVIVTKGSMLNDTCLDRLTLKRCVFQTVTPLRLSMKFAKVIESNLAGLHLVGELKLNGTVWDEVSRQTLPRSLQVQLKLIENQKVA